MLWDFRGQADGGKNRSLIVYLHGLKSLSVISHVSVGVINFPTIFIGQSIKRVPVSLIRSSSLKWNRF